MSTTPNNCQAATAEESKQWVDAINSLLEARERYRLADTQLCSNHDLMLNHDLDLSILSTCAHAVS